MSIEYFECPECGTEIIEADYCVECEGMGKVLEAVCGEAMYITCPECNGTGKSHNYHCSHCNWSFEE